MKRIFVKISICLFLVQQGLVAFAADAGKQDSAKELSGISIVGNKEAPKSLFIVPWKSSELGIETGLASKLLNEKMEVVDKDVFERELEFYSSTVNE